MKKDITSIENVQRRATKMVPQLKDMSYRQIETTEDANFKIPENQRIEISLSRLKL